MSLIPDYLERLSRNQASKHTIKASRSDLRAAEKAMGIVLHQAEAEDLEAYMKALHAKGLAAVTIRRHQSSLRSFFAYLVKSRAIAADPTAVFEAPRVPDRLPIFMTPAQVRQLFAALGDETPAQLREAVIVKTLYYTGMRASELAGLDVDHLDLEYGKRIRVFGKGGRERMLPIGRELRPVLEAYLAQHPFGAGALLVTLEAPHRRIDYDTVLRVFKRVIERAGLDPKFGPHKMRHTMATTLIRRNVSIDKIQKVLGHRSITTTTRYAHTDIEDGMRDLMDDAL